VCTSLVDHSCYIVETNLALLGLPLLTLPLLLLFFSFLLLLVHCVIDDGNRRKALFIFARSDSFREFLAAGAKVVAHDSLAVGAKVSDTDSSLNLFQIQRLFALSTVDHTVSPPTVKAEPLWTHGPL
jgi:hypothetical protein